MKRERSLVDLLRHDAASKARNAIRRMQQQISSRLVAMTETVENLLEHLTEKEAVHFLHAACEMDLSEATAYVKASTTLKDSRELMKKVRAGFPLLKSLATTDTETRNEALSRIQAGATLGARDVSAIRSYHKRQKQSWVEIKMKEQLACARKAASMRMAEQMRAVDIQVADIMQGVDRLRSNQIDGPTKTDLINDLKAAAKTALPCVEQTYGKPTVTLRTRLDNRSRSTDLAYTALLNIAEGRVGGQYGFTIGTSPQDRIGFERCLQQVTTALPSKPAHADMLGWRPDAPTVIELCAGAGGMAIGLENAGYVPVALFEYNKDAAATLRLNRPAWPVIQADIRSVDFKSYRDKRIDLLVGGLPCQPYSIEGLGLGKDDPRDLLPEGARAVEDIRPHAFVFENVVGLLHARHADHLGLFLKRLRKAGYSIQIVRMEADDYGVPQERTRIMIVGMHKDKMAAFRMPPRFPELRTNIGDAIGDLMAENGWTGAAAWAETNRNAVVTKNGRQFRGMLASTVVGRKGGSRAKEMERWASKLIDIRNVADGAPTQAEADAAGAGFLPSLTLRMRARLQKIPDSWVFVGGKDSASRQIGNAVPPPVGMAIGLAVRAALQDMTFDSAEALLSESPKTLRQSEPLILDPVPSLEPALHETNGSPLRLMET